MNPRPTRSDWLVLLLLLGLGLGLRLWSTAGRQPAVGDERVYQAYVEWTERNGFLNYPDLVEQFLESQRKEAEPLLPPTRVTFVAGGRAVQALTGWSALDALRHFALLCSVGMLFATWWIGWLLRGPVLAHGALLLLAVSPLQLHCGRFAFVDVAFAGATTLGLLVVALAHAGRLRAAAGGLVLAIPLVFLTKESAVFALPALAVGLWDPWRAAPADGRRRLALGGAAGTALTAFAVGLLFGGTENFLDGALMLAAKTKTSDYSATYQNGPWFRYLVDYLLMSPLTLLAVIATASRWPARLGSGAIALGAFVLLTLLPMSLLEAGLNLRFALMWDPVLRLLLAGAIVLPAAGASPRPKLAWTALLLLALADLVHYARFFQRAGLYDPITLGLLRALGWYRGDDLFQP